MSKNEWTSVRDDKPYDGEDVIVAWLPKDRRRCPYKHFWAFTTYYKESGFEDFLNKDAPFSKNEIEVVAWMPMPEEYEVEDGKIDADEAYKVLTDYYHHGTEIQHKALKEAIERVPTVDAVEVVRCKDCRFFHRYGFKLEYAECVNFDFYDTTEDGYCCWAERKEDG